MSKKRAPTTVLNHDNWDEEVESEEPGVFTPADSETIKGRVIKKAKRRGLQNAVSDKYHKPRFGLII